MYIQGRIVYSNMSNEPDEKEFKNYAIPTNNMGAISYHLKARNLLIMAIGSDEFITGK